METENEKNNPNTEEMGIVPDSVSTEEMIITEAEKTGFFTTQILNAINWMLDPIIRGLNFYTNSVSSEQDPQLQPAPRKKIKEDMETDSASEMVITVSLDQVLNASAPLTVIERVRQLECIVKEGLPMNTEDELKYLNKILNLSNLSANDKIRLVQVLITHGANINAKDSYGNPVIESLLLNKYISVNDKFILTKALIDLGANINAKDSYGNPIIESLLRDKDISVNDKFILTKALKWADINAKNGSGSPVIASLLCDNDISVHDKIKLTKVLIDLGADINAQNNEGNPIISLLLQTDLNHIFSEQEHLRILTALIKLGANVNLINNKGLPPLCFAQNNEECKRILLNAGADLVIAERAAVSLQRIKLLAQTCTLDGKGKIKTKDGIKEIDLEGMSSTDRYNYRFSIDVLKNLAENPDESEENKKCWKTVSSWMENSYNECYAFPLSPKFGNNEPRFISTGVPGHAIGVVLYKNELFICNRGEGSDPSGIKKHLINRNLPTFVSDIVALINKEASSIENFNKIVQKLEHEKIHDEFIRSPQKVGNCSWTSTEAAVLAMLHIFSQIEQGKHQTSGELEEITETRYKQFTQKARAIAVNEYLKETYLDPDLLEAVIQKLEKNPNIFIKNSQISEKP